MTHFNYKKYDPFVSCGRSFKEMMKEFFPKPSECDHNYYCCKCSEKVDENIQNIIKQKMRGL